MMRFVMFFLFFVISFSACCQVDSIKTQKRFLADEKGKQGYWMLPSAFNYVYKGVVIRGFEAYASGYYKDNKRIGLWEIKDEKGLLLGYRIFYENDSYIEVQFRNKRVVTILTYNRVFAKDENDVDHYFVAEVISFNKRGKFIKRDFFQE